MEISVSVAILKHVDSLSQETTYIIRTGYLTSVSEETLK
jgi:hypothetical protein